MTVTHSSCYSQLLHLHYLACLHCVDVPVDYANDNDATLTRIFTCRNVEGAPVLAQILPRYAAPLYPFDAGRNSFRYRHYISPATLDVRSTQNADYPRRYVVPAAVAAAQPGGSGGCLIPYTVSDLFAPRAGAADPIAYLVSAAFPCTAWRLQTDAYLRTIAIPFICAHINGDLTYTAGLLT